MNGADSRVDSEVQGAIATFLQILEVMPDDLASLEALWRAYSDIGDVTHAVKYLIMLSDALIEQGDVGSAKRVLSAIKGAGYSDPRAAEVVNRLEKMTGDSIPGRKRRPAASTIRLDLSEELALMWCLRETGFVDEDTYAHVASVLSDESIIPEEGATAMHVLAMRENLDIDAIYLFLSKEFDTPIIDLSWFNVDEEMASLLPRELLETRQAVAFGRFGDDDIQVAILNPASEKLATAIKEAAGRNCHFCLCRPEAIDAIADELTDAPTQAQG